MMEQPEYRPPPPEPRVPMGKLWTALVVPPVLAAIAGIVSGVDFGVGLDAVRYVFMIVTAGFTVMLFLFASAVRARYRGPSLLYLNVAFVLGQIIVCTAVVFGSCLVAYSVAS
jgi:hypothetical protein